jgi:hypothetical protein
MIVRILAEVRAAMNEVARMSGGQRGNTAAKKMNTGRAGTANRAARAAAGKRTAERLARGDAKRGEVHYDGVANGDPLTHFLSQSPEISFLAPMALLGNQ